MKKSARRGLPEEGFVIPGAGGTGLGFIDKSGECHVTFLSNAY